MIITDGGPGCQGVRFVFIHVYKCGGSSVRAALMKWHSTALEQHYGLTQHSRAADVRKKMGAAKWAQYISFAVIRNPCDRLVSRYYYNKHINTQMPLDEYARTVGCAAYMSQSEFVCDDQGRVIVSHLLRFEHLEQDLNELLTNIGLPPVQLPRFNVGNHPPYEDLCDASLRASLEPTRDMQLWRELSKGMPNYVNHVRTTTKIKH